MPFNPNKKQLHKYAYKELAELYFAFCWFELRIKSDETVRYGEVASVPSQQWHISFPLMANPTKFDPASCSSILFSTRPIFSYWFAFLVTEPALCPLWAPPILFLDSSRFRPTPPFM